jgi:hypothetical protein
MTNADKNQKNAGSRIEVDYETYKLLLSLWQAENPIKTNKLQVLLAVNALLVSAVSISGGFAGDNWYVYLAGAVFSFIWTFSIGRTALFQDAWQIKMQALQARYPRDPRFSVLDTRAVLKQARWWVRVLGGIPSRWYLLFSPLAFAIVWLAIFVVTRGP